MVFEMAKDGKGWLERIMDRLGWIWIDGDGYGWLEMAKDGWRSVWMAVNCNGYIVMDS